MADTNKLLGQTINNRYRVIELIGKGGSGYVYNALNVENDVVVALKILKEVSLHDPESVIRFEKEVAVSAKLTNPHTVRVYEFGKTVEGYLLIAMELLEGRPLTKVIEDEAPLSPRRTVSIVTQTLEALAEAHRVGIVHRDLKPDNIFILTADNGSDFVKVLDFGIAKFLHDDTVGDTLTRDGFIFGTPLYISPEQALGWQVSPASDIYSLGAVFFEMLAGVPPFNAETPIGLGMKHIYEPPPLDKLKVEGGSYTGLKHLLSLMLEKRPERRPANAGTALALFHALDELGDTPFDISPMQGGQVQAENGAANSPTVKAKPVTGKTEEVREFLEAEATGQVPESSEEGPEAPEESSEETEAAAAAAETSTRRKKKKRKRGRGRKKKREEALQAAPEAEAEAEPEPEPEAAAPEAGPEPEAAAPEAEAAAPEAEEPVEQEQVEEPAEAAPESIQEAEIVEESPKPPERVAQETASYEEEARRVVEEHVRAEPEADFGLLPEAPVPPRAWERDYASYEDSEEDIWAPAKRRKGPPAVGLFAWAVLLLGLLLAGFVLYALFAGGKQFPKSPEDRTFNKVRAYITAEPPAGDRSASGPVRR